MADINDDIARYFNGELSPAEMHHLEKRALHDAFLADALEGGALYANKKFSVDLREIEKQIREKQSQKIRFTALRIAASVLLIGIVSTGIYVAYFHSEDKTPKIASAKVKPGEKVDNISGGVADEKKNAKKDLLAVETPSAQVITKHSDKASSRTNDETKKAEYPDPVVAAPTIDSYSVTSVSRDTTTAVEIIDVAKDKTAVDKPLPLVSMQVAKTEKVEEDDSEMKAPKSFPSSRGKAALMGNASAGVHVTVKGTTIASQTDAQGNIDISKAKEMVGQQLIFSSEGFLPAEVVTPEQSNVNVQLSDEKGKRPEIVVEAEYKRDDPLTEFAQPSGGYRSFDNYLEKNIHYPPAAVKKNIQGKVTVEFFVKRDSTLSDFRVIHGLGNGCEEELIRLIKEGPVWIPLKQSDTLFESKVRVRFKFALPK